MFDLLLKLTSPDHSRAASPPTVCRVSHTLRRLLGIIAATAAFAAGCGGSGSETSAGLGGNEGVAADWPHTFIADQLGGGQFDANDLAGRDVILWFWAPW